MVQKKSEHSDVPTDRCEVRSRILHRSGVDARTALEKQLDDRHTPSAASESEAVMRYRLAAIKVPTHRVNVALKDEGVELGEHRL